MSQPALFDADKTGDTQCPVCGAIKPAGHETTPDCEHDRRDGEYTRRPAACLNAHDPRYADLPF